jgi:hypothetical protein
MESSPVGRPDVRWPLASAVRRKNSARGDEMREAAMAHERATVEGAGHAVERLRAGRGEVQSLEARIKALETRLQDIEP